MKIGKFGGVFGGLPRRLQKDGQRTMPQLTPNVPEYAKHFSVELFEIDIIDEIDEKNRRKRRNRQKISTKTTNKNDEIDEEMGCYMGLIFVVFIRQFRRFRQILSSISLNFFVIFVDFIVFVKSGGGSFFAPFSVTFSGPPCEGGGEGGVLGLVCGVWGQWHQGLEGSVQ